MRDSLAATSRTIQRRVRLMSEKNCSTCIDNEDGLCDRKGILVEEDDACESWNDGEGWKEHFLRTFLAGH